MATHDYVIANGTGAAVRSDLNNALAAVVSNNSGSSAPSTTYAYQWWADSGSSLLKMRNSGNSAWVTMQKLDGTVLLQDGSASSPGLSFADDTNTGIFSGAADQINISTGGSERLRVDSSGHFYIGDFGSPTPGFGNTTVGTTFQETNDGSRLLISRASNVCIHTNRNTDGISSAFQRGGTTVGSISVTTNSTSYNTTSDYRLKENVAALTDGITRVKQLLPKRFNFIAEPGTTVDGFLAHEAQAVVPEAVIGTHNEVDDDGNAVMQGIDQAKLVPLLTAALQEAIAKIETLETKVAALEAA